MSISVVVVVVYTYTSGMLYWGLGLLLGSFKDYLFMLFIWMVTHLIDITINYLLTHC